MECEQLDIFSLLPKDQDRFCSDEDVNEIYKRLTRLAKDKNLEIGNTDWSIWDHVPQFGYRMTFELRMRKDQCTEEFFKELDEIVTFAKDRGVELSPFAPHFYREDEVAVMYIFSTFIDSKRRKIK